MRERQELHTDSGVDRAGTGSVWQLMQILTRLRGLLDVATSRLAVLWPEFMAIN